ncbi:sulfate ABC transporter permease [Demequina sp. NBRC 110057]|uniref:sulfate ABC transporter permease n=1 Tax=Demequina sp. NBRC 110057 TaxID=1570346 RepID=UPI000A049B3D|nr:sulfate ABC transporter permease subunit [Demequina sp. NBRC 110057]
MVDIASPPVAPRRREPRDAATLGRPAGRRIGPLILRAVVIVYVGLLVAWPVALVFWNTFADGLAPVIETFTDPLVLASLRLTAIAAAASVVLNVVFGVTVSLVLVRYEFPGKRLLNAILDLPLSVSPVVVGLSIVLVYESTRGIFGVPLAAAGIQVLFSTPGIILATTFIAMPLVIREIVPVLTEVGTEQEQAARSLGASGPQTFWRITIPAIRWGLTYGVVLCLARSIGEFGAVKVVSGNLIGQTQTATLMVEQMYFDFDQEQAFAVAGLLASISIIAIVVVSVLRSRAERKGTS